jgi:hypothetical protein
VRVGPARTPAASGAGAIRTRGVGWDARARAEHADACWILRDEKNDTSNGSCVASSVVAGRQCA